MIITDIKAMIKDAEPARRVEIFTGAGRRRDWSDEDRASIVAESYAGFDSVSGVARRHGLAPSQLFTWRRLAREALATPMFVPVVREDGISTDATSVMPKRSKVASRNRSVGLIEVELNGGVVRVGQGADAATVVAVLQALKGVS
jgi:transposase